MQIMHFSNINDKYKLPEIQEEAKMKTGEIFNIY